jgi:hypothetical protein
VTQIGVVGGYGAVGAAAVRALAAARAGSLRIGGRDGDRALELAARHGAVGMAVDAIDVRSLERFCAGCDVVVNCAGPSCAIRDSVARAAADAGAAYVDAAGDDMLYDALAGAARRPRTAVVSAGMTPGLSALLPRFLAAHLDRPRSLTAYAGGRDRFTRTAAVDYADALAGGYGTPNAAWDTALGVRGYLAPRIDERLPFFPRPVLAQPFLSTETERVARRLRLEEARWYTVLDGDHVRAALTRLRAESSYAAGAALERASALDLVDAAPYQLFVLQVDGEDDGEPATRTLVARGTTASVLTGTVAAVATLAVLRGEIPPGVARFGEDADPALARAVEDAGGFVTLDVLEGAADPAALVEEGVL